MCGKGQFDFQLGQYPLRGQQGIINRITLIRFRGHWFFKR
jgi:hypothetical protein